MAHRPHHLEDGTGWDSEWMGYFCCPPQRTDLDALYEALYGLW